MKVSSFPAAMRSRGRTTVIQTISNATSWCCGHTVGGCLFLLGRSVRSLMGSLPPLLWSWMIRQSPVNSSVAGFFFGTAAKGDGWTSVIRSSTSSDMIQATPMAKSRQKRRRMSC